MDAAADEQAAAPTGSPFPRVRVAIAVVAALGVGVALGVVLGRAHAAPSPSHPQMVAVHGTVVVHTFDLAGDGASPICTSGGSVTDVQVGTPVVVSSTQPRVLGATLLKRSFFDGTACRFTFDLAVPASGQWYDFQVGDRVLPAVPRSQLARVQLPVG